MENGQVSASSAASTININNLIHGDRLGDTLHGKIKAQTATGCTRHGCVGSLLATPNSTSIKVRDKSQVLLQATEFLEEYYNSIKQMDDASHLLRLEEVKASIEKTNTYELTYSELTFGCKQAWRNAARCIGRIQWSKLQVFDARHVTTARDMFNAICEHVKYATNEGNIRSTITVFAPRTDGKHDFRVWNPQLIMYAGYKQDDGSVIGDKAHVKFTELCERLGWHGQGGHFDVLPLVLQANGEDPELFELPESLVLQVELKHPKYEWFEALGLRWYALPAVSNMILDCGGLEFTAAPFNGWYMGTEIGARDLCDQNRYNILETVATKMGLDMHSSSSLWKDRVLVETNIAVLYSYQNKGVTITDHHTASESFITHMKKENQLRGGCPADWVWIVPPMSGSLTEVFHQEMLKYHLKPSYEYQVDAWQTHEWKDKEMMKKVGRKQIRFIELAKAVMFSTILMHQALAKRIKCLILFASETGKSESYARRLCSMFNKVFHAEVKCMEDYDVADLEDETLVLVVTSTFGNGDAPDNGQTFVKALKNLQATAMKGKDKPTFLKNVRFSVFGLGSRSYPNFCVFGKLIDSLFAELGAHRIHSFAEGDELSGQEQSFREWAAGVFNAACVHFNLSKPLDLKDTSEVLTSTDLDWNPEDYRLVPVTKKHNLERGLAQVSKKDVKMFKLKSRTTLTSNAAKRQVILVTFDATENAGKLNYEAGDHVGIFPANQKKTVDGILSLLDDCPDPDDTVQLQVKDSVGQWKVDERLPPMTIRTALTNYLDINSAPSPKLIQNMAKIARKEIDKKMLHELSENSKLYEEWKLWKSPTILEMLREFPSLKIASTLLLAKLPLLKYRLYSISSSPLPHPGEIHATLSVHSYKTKGGAGSEHRGVCSNWLNTITLGTEIPCFIRKAPLFRIPEDKSAPVIMVGAGTGIAPYRGFWEERQEQLKRGDCKGYGPMTLYFGCRDPKHDYLHEKEIKTCLKAGVLENVHVAFSRSANHTKSYVQDIIELNAELIYRTLENDGGHIYICGGAAMADDVESTLVNIIQGQRNQSTDEAKAYLSKLRNEGRIHEDIFGASPKETTSEDYKMFAALRNWENNKSREGGCFKGWLRLLRGRNVIRAMEY